MKYKLRPPARGANEPSYPHLDLSNLPPKPGPSRIERQIKAETKLAYDHYRQLATGHSIHHSGGRCPVPCPECAVVIRTLTWGMSAAWYKVDVERLFRR